jgi:Tol biopolymer transport system component
MALSKTYRLDASTNKLLKAACLLLLVCCASAFGFGKNKVEHEHFSWRYYQSPHFEVFFYQDQGVLPAVAARWLEDDFESLRNDFSFGPKDKFPVILYGSPNSFAQTNIVSDILPEGVGGFTTQMKNRIVVPFDGSYDELRHVLHHELVHGFQYAILFEQFGSSIFTGGNIQMPLWFAEGLAEYLSSGWNTEADMFLMDAVVNGSVGLPGAELGGYMAYKGGQSFFAFLAASRGEKMFSLFLRRFRDTKNVERSFKEVYGKTPEELGEEWHAELKRLYWPEIGRRRAPSTSSVALTAHEKDRDNFNLKPRISPDGTQIAYFSDLRDYTRILVCNTRGSIISEVGSFGYAGTFESFHPFRSGMCWSPQSDKLAFISNNNGRDQFRIIDVKRKKLVSTFEPALSSVFAPDWSPDGSAIVFCGVDKGYCDLFLYDIRARSCTRLTNNIFTEGAPRFTRDGAGIVFSRQQDTCGSPDRALRARGGKPNQLWYLDMAAHTCRQLTFSPGNKKEPCFSPDGKSLLYVSDRNGIDNIYTAPFASPDSAHGVTDVIGFVSSPDFARDSSTLVYCLFQKGGWDIWRMSNPLSKTLPRLPEKTKWIESCDDTSARFFVAAALQDTTLPHVQKDSAAHHSGHALPAPAQRQEPEVETIGEISERDTTPAAPGKDTIAVKKPDTVASPGSRATAKAVVVGADTAARTVRPAVPDFDTVQPRPYRLRFTPDIISVGLGTNAYYGYGVAGQLAAVFTDLMGNHQIAVMGDIEGNLAEYIHLFASYLNLEHKLNFGGGAFYNREFTSASIFGDSLYFDTDEGLMFLLRFPFSMSTRIDVEGFYENLFRAPYLYDTVSGTPVTDHTRGSRVINMFMPSVSLVYDDILWGITGPLNGTRGQARVVVSPPLHFIDAAFASFDFDLRHYWHLFKRFVWANRLAFGVSIPLREGPDARKFFLGGNDNWLLYNYNAAAYQANIDNFFYSDIIVPLRGWDYLDIIGTKYTVVNTEFRFPFLKEMTIVWPLSLSLRYVNGAFFVDAGNAWNPDEQYAGVPLPKKIYGGVGGGLRANLGIFVLRWDRAWKTDFTTFFGPYKDYFSLGAEF